MDNKEKERSLVEAYNASIDELETRIAAFGDLPDDASDEDVTASRTLVDEGKADCETRKKALDDWKADQEARAQHQKVEVSSEPPAVRVAEPDMYNDRDRGFLYDMFRSQILDDPVATQKIARHQSYELEKRDLTTSTFGGLIPPQYLVDMYAKASRNGRVFCDQVNGMDLPEIGMSLIVPRLTQGLAADIQSAENVTVATQDITETDLTVPVRTIAGYSPVSRQGLERAAYNEEILMEDLVARYWAKLDVQAISGDGTGVNLTGLDHVSGIATSVAFSGGLSGCFSSIADVIQQINTQMGGLGYVADCIVMHPRRWGAFVASRDTAGRPILGISGLPVFNVDGVGSSAGYGYVGTLQGLPVYIDANVPTNLGAGVNEDEILVFCSRVVHLWERQADPVTLAFEQTAGTELSIRLIAYGYVAFTAGRYPAASGKVTGLTPPTFGS